MGKVKVSKNENDISKFRPAITPEARESRMVSLAMDLAEKQMMDGSASSQIITYYLKLGSSLSKLEAEKLKYETALLEVKTKSIESNDRLEKVYNDAIKAMRSYSGHDDEDDEYEPY